MELRIWKERSSWVILRKWCRSMPKMVEWDQTRKEKGTWPRNFMVSLWFKHEISLMVMIDFFINGQHVKARLEVRPPLRALAKAQAMFFRGFKEVGGTRPKVKPFMVIFRFLCGSGPARTEAVCSQYTHAANRKRCGVKKMYRF